MKNYLLLLLAGLLLSCGSTVHAYTLKSDSSVNVGLVDHLIAQTQLLNSGEETELNWVQSVLTDMLGPSVVVSLAAKTDVTESNWQETDTLGVWAYDLVSDGPDYFLVKTGNIGGGVSDTHFLYENLASLDWAVIALAGLQIKDITNIEKISHITEVSEYTTTSVPEPSTLLLLGAGLAGLGWYGRKRSRKQL